MGPKAIHSMSSVAPTFLSPGKARDRNEMRTRFRAHCPHLIRINTDEGISNSEAKRGEDNFFKHKHDKIIFS